MTEKWGGTNGVRQGGTVKAGDNGTAVTVPSGAISFFKISLNLLYNGWNAPCWNHIPEWQDYKHSSAFFSIDFVKRNILIAMSIIAVDMAVEILFFRLWNTEDKDRTTHIAYLMSCHANITSEMSYDKKKTTQKSNTLFPSQTEVKMTNIMDPYSPSYSSWNITLFQNWDNLVSSQIYP